MLMRQPAEKLPQCPVTNTAVSRCILRGWCHLTQTDDLSTGSSSSSSVNPPNWSFSNDSSRPVGERAQCEIEFQVPYDIGESMLAPQTGMLNLCARTWSILVLQTHQLVRT